MHSTLALRYCLPWHVTNVPLLSHRIATHRAATSWCNVDRLAKVINSYVARTSTQQHDSGNVQIELTETSKEPGYVPPVLTPSDASDANER